MNKHLLQEVPGSVQVHNSIDSISENNEAVNYRKEILNILHPYWSTFTYILDIKIGTP